MGCKDSKPETSEPNQPNHEQPDHEPSPSPFGKPKPFATPSERKDKLGSLAPNIDAPPLFSNSTYHNEAKPIEGNNKTQSYAPSNVMEDQINIPTSSRPKKKMPLQAPPLFSNSTYQNEGKPIEGDSKTQSYAPSNVMEDQINIPTSPRPKKKMPLQAPGALEDQTNIPSSPEPKKKLLLQAPGVLEDQTNIHSSPQPKQKMPLQPPGGLYSQS